MKKLQFIACAAALSLTLSALADAPAGYYNRLSGKKEAELKEAAKSVARTHTKVEYGDPTWEAFSKTDTRTVNGRIVWWDMYSNNLVDVSSGHNGLNIEHAVANSWWGKVRNDAYCDLFHLNPSDAEANNRKSNYPLGIVSSATYDNGVTKVGRPAAGTCGGARYVYEPADNYKGDFARAFFYMFTIYDDISWSVTQDDRNFMFDGSAYPSLRPWAYTMLLEWSAMDPVDEKEKNRNEAIYKIQQNRNPFIDHPELADHIWGDRRNEPFILEGGGDPDPGTDPDGVETLFCDFESSSSLSAYLGEGWTSVQRSGTWNCWQVKTFQGNNYAAASAYKSDAALAPFESWLITPAINFDAGKANCLTFRTQGAYRSDNCSLEVYLLDNADPSKANLVKLDAEICVPNPRRTGSDDTTPVYCDWVNSGNVNLSTAKGNGYVGFRYKSAKGGTDSDIATYCVDDVRIGFNKDFSGIGEIGEDVCSVAAWSPAAGQITVSAFGTPVRSAYVFDLSGRMVANPSLDTPVTLDVVPGIYIVSFGQGLSPVKVIVR